MLRPINIKELKYAYEAHQRWLSNTDTGKQLELSDVEINGLNLYKYNLSGIKLTNCKIVNSTFHTCKLSNSTITSVIFQNCEFFSNIIASTNIESCLLRRSFYLQNSFTEVAIKHSYCYDFIIRDGDFDKVTIDHSSLVDSLISDNKFKDSIFSKNTFNNVHISNNGFLDCEHKSASRHNHQTSFLKLTCPEEGSFIGFKQIFINKKFGCGNIQRVIAKLLIPEDAKRSSSNSRKCRCDKAKVLSITSLDGTKEYPWGFSGFDFGFIYEVGKEVSVDNFDDNRWNECAPGIHFFITRQEAIDY